MHVSIPASLLLLTLAADHAPGPARDYADAVARVERRQADDDSVVVAGGRSMLMTHGDKTPRVFVLLHGFTDAPHQFAPLGDRLFAAGDNVYIPRLPHHAERAGGMRTLGRVTAGELEAFGDSVIDVARGLGDSIIVVGLSAGGNVTGVVAQHRADILRAVLIAPALAAGRISDDGARTLAIVGSTLPNITRTAATDTTRPDFVQGISTRGLGQVLKLGDMIRSESERQPARAKQIVFILNQNDQTVSNDAAVELARRWTAGAPLVSVYQFPLALRLQHNVMEATERGGNLELVLPVVEAAARGERVPDTARYQFIISDWGLPRVP